MECYENRLGTKRWAWTSNLKMLCKRILGPPEVRILCRPMYQGLEHGPRFSKDSLDPTQKRRWNADVTISNTEVRDGNPLMNEGMIRS